MKKTKFYNIPNSGSPQVILKQNKSAVVPVSEKKKGSTQKALQQGLIDAFSQKSYDEAERLAVELTRKHPNDVFGWKALGVVLTNKGRLHDAVAPMRRVLELDPFDGEAHLNLGTLLHELGQLTEAESSYRKALAILPESPDALNNLGNLLSNLGRPSEAEYCYRQAIIQKPDYARAYSNYGNALLMLDRLDEAEAACRQAIALHPDYEKAYVNLGAVLLHLGKNQEAEASLRKAINLIPGNEKAHNNLGTVYLEQGRLQEAQACFERALQFNPLYAECHNNLSQVKTYTPDDPHIQLLSQVIQQSQYPMERMHACFALGKACTDLKQYEEAYAILSEGNRLRKALLNYSAEQDRELFVRIKQAFDSLPPAFDEVPSLSQAILIVGMPRSGTTLVEQILASHPQVIGGGELDFLNRSFTANLGISSPSIEATCRQVAQTYAVELDRLREGLPRITDKMPLNFRWLGFVLRANPHLKVIHSIRDPIATCWSIYRLNFPANGFGAAYDLEDLGTYYRMYEDLMAFWHEKFPGRIYDLNYECLTENQEEETRKLLEYCGLPWDDRCLEFEKTDRPVSTASAAQVRKKMYQGSSEAWRPYEPYLGPLMKALGRSA